MVNDLIQIICNYLDQEDFLKLKNVYKFLNYKIYQKNLAHKLEFSNPVRELYFASIPGRKYNYFTYECKQQQIPNDLVQLICNYLDMKTFLKVQKEYKFLSYKLYKKNIKYKPKPGSLLELVTMGNQDKILRSKPDFSFFKSTYTRFSSFAPESFEIKN